MQGRQCILLRALPNDVINLIVGFVECGDLLPLALTCKLLHFRASLLAWRVGADPCIWVTRASANANRLNWSVNTMHYEPNVKTLTSIAFRSRGREDVDFYKDTRRKYALNEDESTFRSVGASGCDLMIRWMLMHFRLDTRPVRCMMTGMAHFDNVNSLELVSRLLSRRSIRDYSVQLMRECVFAGSLQSLKYVMHLVVESDGGITFTDDEVRSLVSIAVRAGRVDVLTHVHEFFQEHVAPQWKEHIFASCFPEHDEMSAQWRENGWPKELFRAVNHLDTFTYLCEVMFESSPPKREALRSAVEFRDLDILAYIHNNYFPVRTWGDDVWKLAMTSPCEWMEVGSRLSLTNAVYNMDKEALRFSATFARSVMDVYLRLDFLECYKNMPALREEKEGRCIHVLRWMIDRGMEVTTGLFETAAFHQSVRTLEFLKDVSSPPSVHTLLPEASRGVCTISHGDAIFSTAPAIMIPVRARLFKEVATYLLQDEVGAKWDESCMIHVATGMMQFADQYPNLSKTLAHLLTWMRSEGAMAEEGDA